MKLYGSPISNNVFRPLLVAKHLGLNVEIVAVDMMKGEHKGEAYRKLNPHGRIPVLEDGSYVLWESIAIAQYLAAQKPSELWPDNARARATITSWQAWGIAHLGKAVSPVQFNRLFKPMLKMGDPDEAAIAQGTQNFENETAVLEDRFSDTDSGWLVGDGLTLADYDIAGWFMHCEAAGLQTKPKTAAWLERVQSQPAWSAAMQDMRLPA